MFIDTETTGFPRKDYRLCRCNIVEIGWAITNSAGIILEEYYTCIKPVGFYISRKSCHGIKHAYAMRYGKPIVETLHKFLDAVDSVDVIVGHNIQFDLRVINNMLLKKGIDAVIDKEIQCTYKMSRKKLSVLYKELFDKDFDAHRVKEDIMATLKCWQKLNQ